MARARDVKRVRVLAWIGWPLVVVVAGISLLHFVRYRLGWEVDWEWSALHLLQFVVVLLAPPVIAEVVLRRGRNDG